MTRRFCTLFVTPSRLTLPPFLSSDALIETSSPRPELSTKPTSLRFKTNLSSPLSMKRRSELNVATLLEGSLLKAEDKLRITVRLTSAKDGGQLWFQSYECDVRDVFEIQDEITAAIIGALAYRMGWKLTQSGGPRLILSKPSLTNDPVAYDLYLKGLYFWNQKNPQGIRKSIEWFRKAIDRDGEYALAHAALADSYLTLAAREDDPDERTRLYGAGHKEIEKYLRMVKDNYEQKMPG